MSVAKAGMSSHRHGRNREFSFTTGNLVLVKWDDGMVYFAKVKRIDHKKQKCTVVFDDKSQDEADFSQIHSVDETTTDIICIKCKKDNSDSPNEIVLCDMCGIGFHQKCHIPPIPISALQLDMPWNCSYCQQGVKCPFLTESLDVLQNLLSDDNDATSGDEEDGGTESEYNEGVRDDSGSKRTGSHRKRKGKKTYESSLHAKQDRRKSLRLHTPTPELSPLVTTERKNRSSAAHSSVETKDTSTDFAQPKSTASPSDSDPVNLKSPVNRKRKKQHSLTNAKRMKRSSVESRTVSVTRINTPIYEEASINFFSPESDDYSPSKVMLSSAANSSPEKELGASKGFPIDDVTTIPETPLLETSPKLKKRQFRVSLSFNPEAAEKGASGKSKLKSPLLFGPAAPSWDDISPKNLEKSPSVASSPGSSVLQKTDSSKEMEHLPFLASPLPTSKSISPISVKQGSEAISPPPSVGSTKSCTAEKSPQDGDKSVPMPLASSVKTSEVKLGLFPVLTDVVPPPVGDETAPSKPVSPAIPDDIGIPEPESASPPTAVDTHASPGVLDTQVFSTLAHPSAITETIVVTSTLMDDEDVSETKKIQKPLSPGCSDVKPLSAVCSKATDVAIDDSRPSATAEAGSSNAPNCSMMDVGVTGKAKTRPSTLTTNPVAISSIKSSSSQSTSKSPPTTKSTTANITSLVPVSSDCKTPSKLHRNDDESAGHKNSPKLAKSQPQDMQVATKVTTTTAPGKPQSPTSSVSKQEANEQSPRNNGDHSKEKAIEGQQMNNPGLSLPSEKRSSVTSASTVAAKGGTQTPVITTQPQVGIQPHHKQLAKTDREPATTPKTAEIKPPFVPTSDTGLSQRLEEIVSKATGEAESTKHVEPDVIITAVEKKDPEGKDKSMEAGRRRDASTSTQGKPGPRASPANQVSQLHPSAVASPTSPHYTNQTPAACGPPAYYQVSSKEHPPMYTTSAQPVTHVLHSANTTTLSHPAPQAKGSSPQPKSVIHHPSHVYFSAESMVVGKSGVHPSSVATTKPYAIVNAIPTQTAGEVAYKQVPVPEKVPGVPAEGVVDGSGAGKQQQQQQHHAVQVVQTAGGRVTQFISNQAIPPGHVLSAEVVATAAGTTPGTRPPPSYSSFVSERNADRNSTMDEDLQSIQKKIGDAFNQSSEAMLISAFEDAWKKFQANDRAYSDKDKASASASGEKPFPANIGTTEPSKLVHQRPRVIAPMPSSEKTRGQPAGNRPIAPKYHTAVATAPDGSQQQVALQTIGNTTMVYAIPAGHGHAGSKHPQHVHVAGLYYPAVETTDSFSQQPQQLSVAGGAPEHQPTAKHATAVVTRALPPQHQHHHHHHRNQRGTSHSGKSRGSTASANSSGGGGGGSSQSKGTNTISSKKTVNRCAKCGENATYVCSGCRTEWYCSRECQLRCWESHSEVCTA